MTMPLPESAALAVSVTVDPLPLRRSFQISHMTIEKVDIVRLTVSAPGDERAGEGEIAADLGYGQDATLIAAEARALAVRLAGSPVWDDLSLLIALLDQHGPAVSGPARMLVEMAFLDGAAKRAGVPVWRLLRLPEPGVVRLLHTVPIGEPIPGRGPLKIKLGAGDDAAVLRGLVGVTGPVILDVNRGWDRRKWNALRQLVVEVGPAVLEDPVRDRELLSEVRGALPGTGVVLDEGIVCLADVEQATAIAGGANLKLMRFGGLLPALAALEHLTACGATRMLGCFLEPPRAIAYAAQLAGMCEWTDLDGHFWLTDDPAVLSYRLDSSLPGIPRIRY